MKRRKRLDKIRLMKEGLFGEYYDKKLDDYVIQGIRAGGKKKGEFLWQNVEKTIEVDKGVTLLDLIKFLATMNSEELHALSTIANANLAQYLIEFCKNPDPIPDNDDGQPLKAIEVYRTMELSNYTDGNDVYDLNDYTCAHGIGEIWEDCMKDVRAGKTKLKDVEHCNAYAIEFTPWQKMLHLPIQIREFVYYSETEWKKCKSRPWMINVMGKKKKYKMGSFNREIVKKDRMPEKKIRASMGLGQFFTGLFNELCFFGSPDDRNAQSGILKDRVKEVEKFVDKEKKKKKK